MITSEQLKTLSSFTAPALHRALGKAAKDYEFTGAKFLGLTNAGQFCYHVDHKERKGSGSTKVFLTFEAGQVHAGF
jgi:hypothetical protein